MFNDDGWGKGGKGKDPTPAIVIKIAAQVALLAARCDMDVLIAGTYPMPGLDTNKRATFRTGSYSTKAGGLISLETMLHALEDQFETDVLMLQVVKRVRASLHNALAEYGVTLYDVVPGTNKTIKE